MIKPEYKQFQYKVLTCMSLGLTARHVVGVQGCTALQAKCRSDARTEAAPSQSPENEKHSLACWY